MSEGNTRVAQRWLIYAERDLQAAQLLLNQGNNFKKKQGKNTKNMITNKIMEGFSLQNGPQLNTAQQSKDVLLQAQLTPIQQNNITTLKNNFNQALEEYQQLYSQISSSVNTYISRTGSNNPYLSKNIKLKIIGIS